MISVRLLGSFIVKEENGQSLDLSASRMQSLLAYLVLHRNAPQPRQQIAVALWPETSDAQSRTNLRNLLYRLKHTYPVLERYLNEAHGTLQWHADALAQVDVIEFQDAAAEADRYAAAGDQPAERDALERAASIYAGDLLPGVYDDWILPHREELHQIYLTVLERLVILLEAHHDYRQAISFAQRSLRHDPLNETIYRHLIRLHGQFGDRTGGLRVYQTCVQVLSQELGVEPSAATREVYERLLKDSFPAEAPAPATSRPRQAKTNLPHPLTSFIGREREIREVMERVLASRLLTLVGPPGAGKTRLALEASARLVDRDGAFSGGIAWIDMTAAADQPSVNQAAAAALGVREQQAEPLLQTLIQALADQQMLLVLDNAEHVMDPVNAFASAVLRACPNLRLLITSREALGIVGEVTWALPPLTYPVLVGGLPSVSTPPEMDALVRYESVRLFVDRAAAALPTFHLTPRNAAAVAQICGRLEGIPLAVELAAARVKMMTVEQIAARMEESLRLLRASRGGGLTRHQTLEAAIEWSYNLLSEKEKVLLRRLAVFAGGFTLEAAEQVVVCCAEDGTASAIEPGEVLELLSRLIDKSLVKVVERDPSAVRYHLLEMIREYAGDRLSEAGEVEDANAAHARCCIALVEEADPNLRGSQQAVWLDKLEAEHDNLRKALRWAASRQDESAGLRLVNSLWQFWDIRGYFNEGRQWFKTMLRMGSSRTAQRAKAFKGGGALAWSQSDYSEASEHMRASLEIYRELGEKRDVAVGLFNLGLVTYSQMAYAEAVPILEESLALFRELHHQLGIANALNSLGVIASSLGDYHAARPLYEESLAIRKELADQRGLAIGYGNLGVVALRQGDLLEAQQYMDESLRLYQEIGDKRGSATTLNEMGQLAHRQGNTALAYAHYHTAIAIWQELGSKEGLATAFEGITAAACGGGNELHAVKLIAAAGALREAGGAPLLPSDVPEHERTVANLRARVGEEAFRRAWNQGRTLTMEEALTLAKSFA